MQKIRLIVARILCCLGIASMSGIIKASDPYSVPVRGYMTTGKGEFCHGDLKVDLSGFARKTSPEAINPLFNTEWQWCIPGMANPLHRSQYLAAMIDTYTNPAQVSRSDFERFSQQLAQRVADDLIDLKRDLTVPGVLKPINTTSIIENQGGKSIAFGDLHNGSIRQWIITEITNDYNNTATGNPAANWVHHGDKILRLKEIGKILGCYASTEIVSTNSEWTAIGLTSTLKAIGTIAVIAALCVYFHKQSKNKKTTNPT